MRHSIAAWSTDLQLAATSEPRGEVEPASLELPQHQPIRNHSLCGTLSRVCESPTLGSSLSATNPQQEPVAHRHRVNHIRPQFAVP